MTLARSRNPVESVKLKADFSPMTQQLSPHCGQGEEHHRMELIAAPESERDHVRRLVLAYGWNATCYQLVNAGLEYWFHERLDAAIGFVRARGFRVAAGAPVCPFENLADVLQAFDQAEPGPVVYYGAGERVHKLLSMQPNHASVSMGAQPIWDPREWSGRVKLRPSLGYQLRRATHKGVSIEEWSSDRAHNSPELRRVLASWLSSRPLPPLHFLVEPETLGYVHDRRVFAASFQGSVVAFLTLAPVPARNGWLTEQFPRLLGAPNGTVELLMDAAARTVAAEGSPYLTMGLVPFSSHGAQEDDPRWLRMLASAARRYGNCFYNFAGLDEFKSKFNPTSWEPIGAIVNQRRFSMAALLASMQAFTGEPLIRTAKRTIRRAMAHRST